MSSLGSGCLSLVPKMAEASETILPGLMRDP